MPPTVSLKPERLAGRPVASDCELAAETTPLGRDARRGQVVVVNGRHGGGGRVIDVVAVPARRCKNHSLAASHQTGIAGWGRDRRRIAVGEDSHRVDAAPLET